jgi:diguanylate cyclase (GGDEF)-like protein/PAS domain S-box-containing protein
MKNERILVVEDEPVVALDLREILEEMGYEVCSICNSLQSAIQAVEQLNPSLVLMDIHLEGDGDGIDACDVIYQRWKLPVIFLTAFADDKTVKRAAASKPFGYLMKPFVSKELYAVLQVARSRHDVEMSLARSEERLSLVVTAAKMGTWEWESRLDQIQGDAQFEEIWGGTLHPFSVGLNAMIERIHPDDQSHIASLLMVPGFFNGTFRAARLNGEYAWLEMHGNLRHCGSDSRMVVGALRDITARKKMEESLRQASVVFNTIAEGIMILDASGLLVSVNPAFSRLTGYEESGVSGLSPAEFLLLRRDGDPSYLEIALTKKGFWSSEVMCKANDGRIFNALQQVCVVRDEQEQAVHFVHTISDLTEIRSTERQLVHLAYHDPLTKLPNRRLLLERLKQALSAAARTQKAGALLFIDLDDFKTLNDTLGHDMGDVLLEQVAARLLSCVRENDTVSRFGGDEFMVMLEQLGPHLTDAAEFTERVARKIIKTLGESYQLNGHEYVSTCSIGAILFDGSHQRFDELVKQADIAMYQSKKDGRNTLSFFDPKMQKSVDEHAKLVSELHIAIQTQQFELYFQVQVDAWRQPIGAEALIRWNHPSRGIVSPAEFIPVAETTGLILPIGVWVLEKACEQIKTWQGDARTQHLVLAVNVSARQLRQLDFVAQVATFIQKYAIPSHLLKLEITEGMLLESIEHTIAIMRTLHEIGVLFSLDDFGTGYSSLAYLKRLPLNQLKVDQSFVRDLVVDSSDRAIVRTIINMAKSLGLDVIAEGVETEEQRQLLQNKGCIHFQGYLFGKPMPIAQFNAAMH